MEIVLAGARLETMINFKLLANPERLVGEVRAFREARGLKPVTSAIFRRKQLECWVEISEGPPLVLTLFGVDNHEVHIVRLRQGWVRTSHRLVLPSESRWRQITRCSFTEHASNEYKRLWQEQCRLFDEDEAVRWCILNTK
ncbi:MAG TPA: hypothetical protein VFT87_01860 [Candidatus Saccharimonadales bacterium]|nr:hypothetical protein [Candidatus Saccharimonadales bacterium]